MFDCHIAWSFSNRRFFFFFPGLFPSKMRLLFSRMDFFLVSTAAPCYCCEPFVAGSRHGVDWACLFLVYEESNIEFVSAAEEVLKRGTGWML